MSQLQALILKQLSLKPIYVERRDHFSNISHIKENCGSNLNVHWEMDKNVVHIYNGLLLGLKEDLNNTTCSNMDWPGDVIPSKVRQTEKDKYHIILLICGI